MDPVTILGLTGIGLSVFGNYQSGLAQSASLQSEAAQARINAITARQKAVIDADAQSIQARKLLGEQITDFAAAGVSGGSVEAVMADSMINAEMDRLSIIFGGDIRSKAFMSEAESKLQASKDIKSAGILGLLSGGFLGASKVMERKG